MDNNKKENILVTGGGGFLGYAIIKKLVKANKTVTNFSRNHYPKLKNLNVREIKGDITDYNSILHAVSNMDTVFHVAAKPGVWGSYNSYYRTNTLGTKNVISACLKNSVSKLIYTSSPSVIFNGKDMEGVNESAAYPLKFHSHYSKTKSLAEKLVIKASCDALKTISLRPHLIWGPKDNHLIPRIIQRADKLIKIGKKDKLVDTIYIDNAAQAHILASKKLDENQALSGKTYFISQDQPIYMWEMINNILKAGRLKPVTKTIPYPAAWFAGAIFELIYKIFKIQKEPQITRFVAKELATAHWFDISAAKKDLGYTPEISTKQGLLILEEWLKTKSDLFI